jgi:tetratricopeptide (TPR) repeat protein
MESAMRQSFLLIAILGTTLLSQTAMAAQRFNSSLAGITAAREAAAARLAQQCNGTDPGRAIPACTSIIDTGGAATILGNAYYGRGLAHFKRNELDAALDDYGHVIALDPKNPVGYLSRANTFSARGDLDKAIADFNLAIELDPNLASAYNNRGTALAGRRDYVAAIADFGKAIELEPSADTYANRGLAYMKRNEIVAALKDLEEAVRRDPDHAVALYNRGFAKQLLGDMTGAEQDFAKAHEINPEVGN